MFTTGIVNIVKMSVLLELTYKFSTIPIKIIEVGHFLWNLTRQFKNAFGRQRTEMSRTALKRKNPSLISGPLVSDSNQDRGQMKLSMGQNRKNNDPYIYGSVTFDKNPKALFHKLIGKKRRISLIHRFRVSRYLFGKQ